jgi:ribosomal-protein-alanine acetyltransferase
MISQRAKETTTEVACVVRRMTIADIPAALAIERRVFPTPWPESAYRYELCFRSDSFFFVLHPLEDLTRPLTPRERIFGRVIPSTLMGYAGFRLRNDSAHICTIAVHPDLQGRGLGKSLLLFILKKAIDRGVERVTLEVRPSNKVAYQLYGQAGFVRTSVRPRYYRDGEDAWLMALRLSDEGAIARLEHMHKRAKADWTSWIDQTGR